MSNLDCEEQIKQLNKIIKAFRTKKELFDKEKDILDIEEQRYKLFYSQIHEFLAPKKTESAEKKIRECVKDIFALDLPVCEAKIQKMQSLLAEYEKKRDEKNTRLCYQYLQKWLTLYENNYALVAFRSLEHFALFMEWDKPDNEKVWKYSLDPYNDGGYTGVNKPFFYYFNQMVLDKKYNFISKQQSTGTGKSYSNSFAISWLWGQDANNDVLVVLGNPALVLTNVKSIIQIVKNPRYVKVFPQFSKYLEQVEDKKGNVTTEVSDSIFSVCRAKEGELTLADSNKPVNLKVISKDTPIDGIRVRFLFLDDVCRSKDAGNMKMHETDVNNYWNSWWKRNYNTEDFYVVLGCTAYSIFDIASTLINYYSKGKMKRSGSYKYAYLSLDEKCVFIKVPKIDEELDRSTYPQKFSYEEAIKIKERDYRSFMAMEQQNPLPPDNSPFYFSNLQCYEVIPEEGRSEFCWASLDTSRTGFDYNAMAIFCEVNGKFYLKDCLYRNVVMEKMYPIIIDKIIQHKITKFVIENNIDVSLKALLTKMLQERGVCYCEIIERYATSMKENKIYNMENAIKTSIIFPEFGLYAYSSEIGRFMNEIYGFSYVHKNEHDDAIDSVATFCQQMVVQPKKSAKAKILYV